jgi:predicted TIM-barrel fold metal-dependent hydrolase
MHVADPVSGGIVENYRIDTHHHAYPPAYMAKEFARITDVSHIYMKNVEAWTPARSVEAMDQNGIATAVVSISTPGVWFGDASAARSLSRIYNEYTAEMKVNHPGRFGVFAALPVPDVDGSLREIEYALDVLKVDGFGLMTNYGTAWPGDPAFGPVFDELNRRKAVVYFHPTAADFFAHLLPGIPAASIEFPFDSARAIASLLFTGTLSRCPDVRFIFSHGGGGLPMVIDRLVGLVGARKDLAALIPQGVMHEIRKLYFDLSGIVNRGTFGAARDLVGTSHLLFGSDFPFYTPERAVKAAGQLEFNPVERQAFERENALALLPSLKPVETTSQKK